MKTFHNLTALAISITISITTTCPAQKGPFNPNEGTGKVWIQDPIDSSTTLCRLLEDKIQKGQITETRITFNDADGAYDKEVFLTLLGMRMTDGMGAILAKNIEELNAATKDIEVLAKRLGAAEMYLVRANKTRNYAQRNKWNRCFIELGFLHKDILNAVAKEDNKDHCSILITAGRIQGFHFRSNLIMKHYSEDVSKYLREPWLAKKMSKDLGSLKPETRNHALISEMLTVCNKLHTIIDVPLNSPISEDKVKEIYKITSQFAKRIQKNPSK